MYWLVLLIVGGGNMFGFGGDLAAKVAAEDAKPTSFCFVVCMLRRGGGGRGMVELIRGSNGGFSTGGNEGRVGKDGGKL